MLRIAYELLFTLTCAFMFFFPLNICLITGAFSGSLQPLQESKLCFRGKTVRPFLPFFLNFCLLCLLLRGY